MRFCIDYRRLNQATKVDAYPLPHIEDSLNTLGGARFFCSLDLASGYWQVEMDAADREKTAFVTQGGLKEFRLMHFGLVNAPATFERLMERVLRGIVWSVRSFVGLCSYYRRHIQGFTELAAPLYELATKGTDFRLVEEGPDQCADTGISSRGRTVVPGHRRERRRNRGGAVPSPGRR